MSKKPAKDKANGATANKTIALNKRARHEYHIEDRYEAGLALQGWEVKAIRAAAPTSSTATPTCGPARST